MGNNKIVKAAHERKHLKQRLKRIPPITDENPGYLHTAAYYCSWTDWLKAQSQLWFYEAH